MPRSLDQLPPLQFPLSPEVWAKYKPSVEEYKLMVEHYWAQRGVDIRQAIATLPPKQVPLPCDEKESEW